MQLESDIESPRLTVRSLDQTADLGPYSQWLEDPEVTRYLEVRFERFTADRLRRHIEDARSNPDVLLLGLFLRENGRHIGNIKLGSINRRHGRADMGILIGAKDQWGRGLATEAIDHVSRYAFRSLGLRCLEAGFYEPHRTSQAAFAKAGFREVARIPEYWAFEGRRVAQIIMQRTHEP